MTASDGRFVNNQLLILVATTYAAGGMGLVPGSCGFDRDGLAPGWKIRRVTVTGNGGERGSKTLFPLNRNP